MQVTAWVCDHTGEFFRDKQTYLRHLRRLATSRRLRCWGERESLRVQAMHAAIWKCGSFEEIAEYLSEHWRSISFTDHEIPDCDNLEISIGGMYWHGERAGWRGEFLIEADETFRFIRLRLGAEALGIKFLEPTLLKHGRQQIGTVQVRPDQPWTNLAVAEKLRGREAKLSPHRPVVVIP